MAGTQKPPKPLISISRRTITPGYSNIAPDTSLEDIKEKAAVQDRVGLGNRREDATGLGGPSRQQVSLSTKQQHWVHASEATVDPTYIRYTPNPNAPGYVLPSLRLHYNSGTGRRMHGSTEQRIIRMGRRRWTLWSHQAQAQESAQRAALAPYPGTALPAAQVDGGGPAGLEGAALYLQLEECARLHHSSRQAPGGRRAGPAGGHHQQPVRNAE
ncbi:unnamed protein product [Sphagnum jensenii]|uniref:Zasp-like motif domain-containing protein n=1 Tax=Sphagnum jensenii TaxID=128206 RepID=A0ABP0V7I6_9BRYO